MSDKPLDRPEPMRRLLLRALLKRGNKEFSATEIFKTLPDKEHHTYYSQIQLSHIDEFHRIVNWPAQITEQIHPCYFHVFAFPQHLKLMLDSDFPFSVLGIVHLENRIEQFGIIDTNKVMEVSSRFGEIKPHAKGLSFSIRSSVKNTNQELWRSESWFLIKQQSKDQQKNKSPSDYGNPNAEYTGSSPWHFSAKTSRRYAKISGDYNPIHLHRLSAKLFGFKSAIAHGMWSKSWCLSALAEFVQPEMEVNVKFAQPLMLPNRVTFHQDKREKHQVFALSTKDGQFVHLKGQLE